MSLVKLRFPIYLLFALSKACGADNVVNIQGTNGQLTKVTDALIEMAAMQYTSLLSLQEVTNSALLRDQIMRLCEFTHHPSNSVRQSASNLLNVIAPSHFLRPLTSASVKELLDAVVDKRFIRGWNQQSHSKPITDVLLDILKIRNNYPRQPVDRFFWDESSKQSLHRLVQYVSDPDRRVRAAAVSTLTALQHERPGGIDEPEKWQDWFRQYEVMLAPGVRPLVEPSDPVDEALLFMLNVPHKSSLVGAQASDLMRTPGTREQLVGLVRLLGHSDSRIKESAYDTLLAIQPERRGGQGDLAAWGYWIGLLEENNGEREPASAVERGSDLEEAMFEIIRIRTHLKPDTAINLIGSEANRTDLKQLIALLGHTHWRVRSAAYKSLLNAVWNGQQHRRPNSAERGVWEKWYQDLQSTQLK